jgi:hypothetical protein
MDVQAVKLGLAAATAIWIETTNVSNRPAFGSWAFGPCLWSPSRYRDGKDRYSLMREEPGVELHPRGHRPRVRHDELYR